MHAIDEVNISVSRRSPEHGIARRVSGGGVRSQIARAEIRFHFNNASRKLLASFAADNQLAQQFTRHGSWVAIEESIGAAAWHRASYRPRLHMSEAFFQSQEMGFPASDTKPQPARW